MGGVGRMISKGERKNGDGEGGAKQVSVWRGGRGGGRCSGKVVAVVRKRRFVERWVLEGRKDGKGGELVVGKHTESRRKLESAKEKARRELQRRIGGSRERTTLCREVCSWRSGGVLWNKRGKEDSEREGRTMLDFSYVLVGRGKRGDFIPGNDRLSRSGQRMLKLDAERL